MRRIWKFDVVGEGGVVYAKDLVMATDNSFLLRDFEDSIKRIFGRDAILQNIRLLAFNKSRSYSFEPSNIVFFPNGLGIRKFYQKYSLSENITSEVFEFLSRYDEKYKNLNVGDYWPLLFKFNYFVYEYFDERKKSVRAYLLVSGQVAQGQVSVSPSGSYDEWGDYFSAGNYFLPSYIVFAKEGGIYYADAEKIKDVRRFIRKKEGEGYRYLCTTIIPPVEVRSVNEVKEFVDKVGSYGVDNFRKQRIIRVLSREWPVIREVAREALGLELKEELMNVNELMEYLQKYGGVCRNIYDMLVPFERMRFSAGLSYEEMKESLKEIVRLWSKYWSDVFKNSGLVEREIEEETQEEEVSM